jgi:hypothetical protein
MPPPAPPQPPQEIPLEDVAPPDELAKKTSKHAPAELPPELEQITEANMYDRCVITDEILPIKKTGEFTGPHKVVYTVRYILENIGKLRRSQEGTHQWRQCY